MESSDEEDESEGENKKGSEAVGDGEHIVVDARVRPASSEEVGSGFSSVMEVSMPHQLNLKVA